MCKDDIVPVNDAGGARVGIACPVVDVAVVIVVVEEGADGIRLDWERANDSKTFTK